jgi:hypothetical protein
MIANYGARFLGKNRTSGAGGVAGKPARPPHGCRRLLLRRGRDQDMFPVQLHGALTDTFDER